MAAESLNCSRDAFDLFHLTRQRVATASGAKRLWKRCLNQAERERLGGTLEHAVENHRGVVSMWRLLRQVSYQRAVIEVGEALGFLTASDVDYLLREGGETPRDPEQAEAEAIARGDLVINRNSRSAFWNGALIEADWNRHNEAWEFLVTACEHALSNEPIDPLSFGDRARGNIVAQKKSRLKNAPGFPLELIEYFRVVAAGTQRFDFPPVRIHIV